MCGLFGVIRPDGITTNDELRIEILAEHLRHRGPDGSAYIRNPSVLMGMHRLSIMDPAHGWQPFWSEDKRLGVLGNGEIYNAAELRRQLSERDHRFHTNSDMEVVPHLIEEFGMEAFTKLRGMFALVVYDRDAREVHLVRDHMGEKPLCYLRQGGAIFFSSEQRALVKAQIAPLTINEQLLPSYLQYGYTPEPYSLIMGIRKVPAASVLTISTQTGTSQVSTFWNPLDDVGDQRISDQEIAEAIEDAVRATCTSDVPVGIALSGGLDSSLLAAFASTVRADLVAFTVGYDTPDSDESSHAAALAKSLGIPCHRTQLQTESVAKGFADICGDRDEPISDIAGSALDALPRAAQAHGVPVLMTGVGGDELFWGYDWIRLLAAWTTNFLIDASLGKNISIARPLSMPPSRQQKFDWLATFGGVQTDRQLRRFLVLGSKTDRVPLPFYEFQPGYRVIQSAMRDLLPDLTSRQTEHFWGSSDADWVGALYTDISNQTYLRVNSFVQVDRLAMRHSIESRTPLADVNLVRKVLSGRLVDGDHLSPPKSRLRRIASSYLPPEIVSRPKRGFTPPVREWALGIWRAQQHALRAEALASHTEISQDAASRWMARPVRRDGRVSQVALRLMTLELWLQSLHSS
jgi:asparagine synthase (glutamine-hydrolysing)